MSSPGEGGGLFLSAAPIDLDTSIHIVLSLVSSGGGAPSAWREAVSGGRSRRSGVTPGTWVSGSFQRVTSSALAAHDSSRRTRQVGASTTAFIHCPRSWSVLARGLAEAFLAGGPWDIDSLVDRGARVLGRRYRWLRPLAERVLAAYPDSPRPRAIRLAGFLWEDARFQLAFHKQKLKLRFTPWQEPAMAPAPAPPASGRCPRSRRRQIWHDSWTSSQTARLVRRLPDARRRRARRSRFATTATDGWRKPSGSLRLIEAPKPRLKQMQRKLLDTISAADSTTRGRAWLSGGTVGHDVRRASRRSDGRAQDGSPRFLRFDHECPGHRHLSHGRLSGAGRPAPNRPVHQYRSGHRCGTHWRKRPTWRARVRSGAVGGNTACPTFRRVLPLRQPWPTWPRTGWTPD